jgi:hypothetical protein
MYLILVYNNHNIPLLTRGSEIEGSSEEAQMKDLRKL